MVPRGGNGGDILRNLGRGLGWEARRPPRLHAGGGSNENLD
jgi:hypothetical protein